MRFMGLPSLTIFYPSMSVRRIAMIYIYIYGPGPFMGYPFGRVSVKHCVSFLKYLHSIRCGVVVVFLESGNGNVLKRL